MSVMLSNKVTDMNKGIDSEMSQVYMYTVFGFKCMEKLLSELSKANNANGSSPLVDHSTRNLEKESALHTTLRHRT